MPNEDPPKDDQSKPQKPKPPEASDQELSEDELKSVSGGLASRTSLSGPGDVCISQL